MHRIWLMILGACAGGGTTSSISTTDPAPVSEPDPCEAVPAAWTQSEPFPESREGGAMVAAGEQLYVLGGFSGTTLTDGVWVRGVDGAWRDGPSLPVARQHMGAVAVADRIYVLGGDDGTARDEVWSLDVTAPDDGWRAETPLRRATTFSAFAVIEGAVWMFGGQDTDGPSDRIFRAEVDEDGALTWERRSSLPSPLVGAGVAVTGTHVVLAGGGRSLARAETDTWSAPLTAEGIGPWSEGPALPAGVMLAAVASAGDVVTVAGGFSGTDSSDQTVQLVNGVWEVRAALPGSRFSTMFSVLERRLEVAGGWEGAFESVRSEAWSTPLCFDAR
ncbi:MAG: hypothetical protein KTR31_07835 [Myxococcales bacterium]|nr:hypothetical protein [Myxococcales bacterium]